jgi:hypothetical protein
MDVPKGIGWMDTAKERFYFPVTDAIGNLGEILT